MWIAIVAALALAQGTDEEAAGERLARAEEQVAKGHFDEAVRTYEQLAKRYPETAAGRLAAKRAKPTGLLGWDWLLRNGDPSNRVDLVFLADGYDLDDLGAYADRVADAVETLATHHPWREYWSYLNVLRGFSVSKDEGVDGFGREYDTALGAHTLSNDYTAIDAETVRTLLAELPENDGVAIGYVRNGWWGSYEEGLGCIGNVESGDGPSKSAGGYLNKMLGHAFAGLGSEEQAQIWQEPPPLVEAPNVSATSDPKKVPWAHWLALDHPYVGVYVGAEGRAKGAWRPSAGDCAMGTWKEDYCPVCRETLVLRIYSLVDPIDACAPPPQPPGVYEPLRIGAKPLELRVRVLQPASHDLEVRWWVLQEELPRFANAAEARAAAAPPPADRASRGPLPALVAKPFAETRANRAGEHALELDAAKLAPGTYRVICRVRDTTEIPRARFPWVVEDERGLLESERAWWVLVRPPE